jgi:hypothetical protein
MGALPYDEVWVADFEFRETPDFGRRVERGEKTGELPRPVCLVARELRSGRRLEFWYSELPARAPFRTDSRSLFIAYNASAELRCFLTLGWELPQRIWDPYLEYNRQVCGQLPPHQGLLAALSRYDIAHISKAEKEAGRDLVLRGGPWTPAEQRSTLDYCATDVEPLGPLLEAMLPEILSRPQGWIQGLVRGRYQAAVARMENAGIPIDLATLQRLRNAWDLIKLQAIDDAGAAVGQHYGVYQDGHWSDRRFLAYLERQGIPWPRTTRTGRMELSDDAFREVAAAFPELEPLRRLRGHLAGLRLEKLAVGADGRNRASLKPFWTYTGRNQPSPDEYVFGPARWIRGLIQPPEGYGVGYLDWQSQELQIAAALSGDVALLADIAAGDAYLTYGHLAGLVPARATKRTHPAQREIAKKAILAPMYGQGEYSLAIQTGLSRHGARRLLELSQARYSVFWRWVDHQQELGELRGWQETVFGWRQRITPKTNPRNMRNFPMQATGAEMLRVACMLGAEAGITVCGPLHDAVLIQAPVAELDDAIATMRGLMEQASAEVLGGHIIGVDDQTVTWPGRLHQGGEAMWEKVMRWAGLGAELAAAAAD